MMAEHNRYSFLHRASVLLLPSLAIVLALWLPFGFSMSGLVEEWDLLGLFTEHGPFLMVHLDGPLPAHAIRPLMPLSFALAYLADRDSFDAWHLLTILSLLAKGGAMTYLISRATGSRGWGVVAAVLVVLYPADTMQMSLRSLHINVAIGLVLVSSALIVAAFEVRSRVCAVATAVAAAFLYMVGLGIYEAGLVLFMIPLAVPFIRLGPGRILRFRKHELGLAAIWLGSVCTYLGYATWASHKVASYQSQVTGGGQGPLATAIAALPKLFTIGAARALLGGWIDAWRMVAVEYTSYLYFGSAVLLIAVVVFLVLRLGRNCEQSAQDAASVSWGLPLRLLLAGLILMLAGYAPFLTSPYHIVVSQRTFLWATPGAAMFWVGILLVVWRWTRVPSIAGACVLLALGFGAQLFQFHHYAELAQRQRAVLRGIVESVDVPAGKAVVVLDESSQIGHSWFFVNGDMLRNAINYLYGRAVGPVEICRTPSMEWQRADEFGRKGRCVEDGTGWTFDFAGSVSGPGGPLSRVEPSRHFAKNDAVVIGVRADGTPTTSAQARADRQRELQAGHDVASRRYRGILAARSSDKFAPMFRDEMVGSSYRWSFGDWWNLDLPTRGSGWREAEWTVNGIVQHSAAWMMNSTAQVLFDLAPVPGAYRVRGVFDQFASDTVRERMSLRINGKAVAMRWTSSTRFEADVPAGTLAAGTNRIDFVSEVDLKYFGLAGRLDWFAVEPGTAPRR